MGSKTHSTRSPKRNKLTGATRKGKERRRVRVRIEKDQTRSI